VTPDPARQRLADLISRARYRDQITIIRRYGREVAIVGPLSLAHSGSKANDHDRDDDGK